MLVFPRHNSIIFLFLIWMNGHYTSQARHLEAVFHQPYTSILKPLLSIPTAILLV